MTNWVLAAYASVLPVLAFFAAVACVLTYLHERCVVLDGNVCALAFKQFRLALFHLHCGRGPPPPPSSPRRALV